MCVHTLMPISPLHPSESRNRPTSRQFSAGGFTRHGEATFSQYARDVNTRRIGRFAAVCAEYQSAVVVDRAVEQMLRQNWRQFNRDQIPNGVHPSESLRRQPFPCVRHPKLAGFVWKSTDCFLDEKRVQIDTVRIEG